MIPDTLKLILCGIILYAVVRLYLTNNTMNNRITKLETENIALNKKLEIFIHSGNKLKDNFQQRNVQQNEPQQQNAQPRQHNINQPQQHNINQPQQQNAQPQQQNAQPQQQNTQQQNTQHEHLKQTRQETSFDEESVTNYISLDKLQNEINDLNISLDDTSEESLDIFNIKESNIQEDSINFENSESSLPEKNISPIQDILNNSETSDIDNIDLQIETIDSEKNKTTDNINFNIESDNNFEDDSDNDSLTNQSSVSFSNMNDGSFIKKLEQIKQTSKFNNLKLKELQDFAIRKYNLEIQKGTRRKTKSELLNEILSAEDI